MLGTKLFAKLKIILNQTESDFNEFEPRLKSAKNRFQLSACLSFETLNTILSGTNHIEAATQIQAAAQML